MFIDIFFYRHSSIYRQVLAHECGHGGFTSNKYINDSLGFVIHSALGCPYFSWQISHAHHHKRTNHISDGESWVPNILDKKSKLPSSSLFAGLVRVVVVWLLGWYIYLMTNITGAKKNLGGSHFWPNQKLYTSEQTIKVLVSTLGVGTMVLTAIYMSCLVGVQTVCVYFVLPLWVCNSYLVSITFLQHTHVDVPHFDSEEFTWLRGALSTVDRSMGSWFDAKLHHIVDSHVAHHMFSKMPFYGAKKATPCVKKYLGVYYKHVDNARLNCSNVEHWLTWWWDFVQGMAEAQSVVKSEEDGYYWFVKE